jgi:hypothetical protein
LNTEEAIEQLKAKKISKSKASAVETELFVQACQRQLGITIAPTSVQIITQRIPVHSNVPIESPMDWLERSVPDGFHIRVIAVAAVGDIQLSGQVNTDGRIFLYAHGKYYRRWPFHRKTTPFTECIDSPQSLINILENPWLVKA